MGMDIELDENLIESMKKNEDHKLVEKAVVEAIRNGKAWTNGDSYFVDDDFRIFEFEINVPLIQIQACESFFYNPREINFKEKE